MDESRKSFNIQYSIFNILLSSLLIISFFYRFYGLTNNHSFWTDESHVAIFARTILERGRPVLENGYSTGTYQWLQYWLSAISARIFGLNEFTIRFPSVLFGTLTVLAVYLLGEELFNKKVALFAAFLTTFLKIEILWSRQARPYQALQFFCLLSAYFVYKIANSKKLEIKKLLGFLISGTLAFLMHGLGLVIFFDGLIFLLITGFARLKKRIMVILSVLFAGLFIFRRLIILNFSNLGRINNLFYYRVFLTDNYLPLIVLAGTGALFLLIEFISHSELKESILKRARGDKRLLLFTIFLGVQSFIVSFLLGQPFIRYFYITFPFIILLACSGINELTSYALRVLKNKLHTGFRPWYFDPPCAFRRNVGTSFCIASSLDLRPRFSLSWNKKSSIFNIQYLVFSILSILLVASLFKAKKLVLWPQTIYSLNEDMQEVPEVDWKKIYGFVGEKLKENKDAVLVANWNDLPIWYLGEERLNYITRKDWNFKNKEDPVSGAKIINSLDEFKEVLAKERAGYFVLDSWDDYLPDGVREYCHQNLKREFEIDRLYPVQPRYWTVWVYSWGI